MSLLVLIIIGGRDMILIMGRDMAVGDTTSLAELLERYDAEHDLLRELVLAEEDRARFTSSKSSDQYRWFRSPNIVCIKKARKLRPLCG
jgi:hypothetical protein